MEHDIGPGDAGPSDAAEPPATTKPPATGEPRVDAALSRLRELDELPVSEHPGIYERVHEQLVEVLGELHSAQAPARQGSAEEGAG